MKPELRLLLALVVFAQSALANAAIPDSVPDAAVVGRGTLAYAFWDVYEAVLYAPQGRWNAAAPHALSIEYFRSLDGKRIADVSISEIRKQGFNDEVQLAAWHAQLQQIFPDVGKGTVLSAVYIPGEQISFYEGIKLIGLIKDDEFGRLFLDIWLGERSSEPELRRALLGQS